MKIDNRRRLGLREFTAPNGLRLLYAQDSSNPLICLQLYIKTGSVQEGHEEYGYAHFMEHLLFKSTKKYPDNSLSDKAAEIGAILNAYTDFDSTCFYLMLPKEKLDTGMELLSEMAFHADFDAEDVENEKRIIIEEIHQYAAEPEMDFIEYVQKNYFETSPLKRPVLGDIASIRSANLHKLNSFYRKHYVPENAFMVAVGDFDPETLQKALLRHFVAWPEQPLPQLSIEHLLPQKWRIFHRKKNGNELLAIALPELNESHPDSEALHIAIRYLAIGKSSLLHKVLVEREKLCSSVKVGSLSGILPGASAILISASRKGLDHKILKIFFDAWLQICNSVIPSDEFSLVKQDIIHNWLYSFAGVEHTANLIAAEEFNGDLSRIDGYGAYIESITAEYVLSAIRRHWKAQAMSLFYQSPKMISAKVQHLLDRVSKIRIPDPALRSDNFYTKSKHELEDNLRLCKSSSSEYHNFVLSNGLKLIYNYQPGQSICGYALSAPLSQLNESKTGLNYFASTMMLYGTQKHSHDQIMRLSRQHGFNIRVLHHLDSTLFRGKCSFEDLPVLLETLSEIIRQPVFDENYLKMLKISASDSLRRERDYPVSVAYKTWFHQLFGQGNNLYSATGKLKDIAAIDIDDCRSWHESWSLGPDFSLCIVGSMEPACLHDLCEQHFSESRQTGRIPQPLLKYSSSATRMRRVYRNLNQSIVHIGALACPASAHEENSAFHVLAHIMGGDISSRFYRVLREKYGYAYQTGFDFSSIRDLGYWYAYAFCDSSNHKKCLGAMRDLLRSVLQDGISPQELDLAKYYLISMSRFDNENASFKAASIANLISLDYDLDFYLNREERLSGIKLDQIQELAERYMQTQDQSTFVMV